MISQIFIVASLAAFAVAMKEGKPSSLTLEECPTNLQRDKFLQTFGQKCYWFMRYYATDYSRAVETCEKTGGKLVTIKSEAVNNFIHNTFKTNYQLDDAHVWIGLTLNSSTGDFTWSDGAPMDYDMLEMNTNYDGYNCVVMSTATGKWQMEQCDGDIMLDNFHGYSCEFDPSSDSVGAKNPDYGR